MDGELDIPFIGLFRGLLLAMAALAMLGFALGSFYTILKFHFYTIQPAEFSASSSGQDRQSLLSRRDRDPPPLQ
jgi:Zn-dependent membrane protease YugP